MDTLAAVLARIRGARVYFDSNCLIYFFEKREPYFTMVSALFRACDRGESFGFTGDAAVAELMVHPYRTKSPADIARAKAFFARSKLLSVVSHDATIFDTAAQLRASMGIKLIDALHAATALQNQCSFLVTNDKDFNALESSAALGVIRLADLLDT
jgi:predicted nucleic acid-binding protein